MKKRIRELQPPHKSGRITVAQAARAFRKVRGDTPKAPLFDEAELLQLADTPSARVVVPSSSTSIAAENSAPAVKKPPRPRRR